MPEPTSARNEAPKAMEAGSGEADTKVDKPLTKSAAKKAEKQRLSEAKKAAKEAAKLVQVPTQNGGMKKEGLGVKGVEDEEAPFVNRTPKGEKKDLSGPLPPGYNPIAVESAWYDWWQTQGFFEPELQDDGSPNKEGVFVIPYPPPNVTGALHCGHALGLALEDCLIRWNRMLGKTVLFNPGIDHAGIATQSVVEKRLAKDSGQSRRDLGREGFLKKVWEWKDDYQVRITSQMARLGGSYDWNRLRFTMDETLSKAVTEAFVRLHDEGVIYRANRIVNWCVKLNTAISNEETEDMKFTKRTLIKVPGYDENEKVEFGVLTKFAYPIEGSDQKISIATTRPETMLGDTGIAVHPEDPRYKHLHGKHAIHPFLGRRLPIVLDPELVDMDFGTGAVKLTPAHDVNDFASAQRHGLEVINILNDDGTINAKGGDRFKGMKRYHARRAVIQAMKEKGLYEGWEDNEMTVAICSRSGDIVEPLIKPQWWVKCKDMAHEAIRRTEAGELTIRPEQSRNDWFRWLNDIEDWCISRQLWWGHRCPVYFVSIEGEDNKEEDGTKWIAGRTLEEAQKRAKQRYHGKRFTLKQDEDVLDTWFSSGLWPFSIMGWPDQTPDLARFYPASLLETGWDIIFFWVVRMVILGIKLTGTVPFHEVFCHAIVRDAQGRKMSKSLGNVIDPIDIVEGIELVRLHKKLEQGNLASDEIAKAKEGQKKSFPKGIPQCGADALRFALCAFTGSNRDINLNISEVEMYRRFCNKLFNATKFAMLKLGNDFVPEPTAEICGDGSLVDKWILGRLNGAAIAVNQSLATRAFNVAAASAFNFWLHELCDVYIEAIKPTTDPGTPDGPRRAAQNTLYTCLDMGLRLLHPFMPFITEEMWQRLPRRPNNRTETIMKAAFPVQHTPYSDPTVEAQFKLVYEGIRAIRSMAATYGLQSNIQVCLETPSPEQRRLFETQALIYKTLIKGCETVTIASSGAEVPPGCQSQPIGNEVIVHLLVQGIVNIQAEILKKEKEIILIGNSSAALKKQMSAPAWAEKTKDEVRKEQEAKLAEYQAKIGILERSIDELRHIAEPSA